MTNKEIIDLYLAAYANKQAGEEYVSKEAAIGGVLRGVGRLMRGGSRALSRGAVGATRMGNRLDAGVGAVGSALRAMPGRAYNYVANTARRGANAVTGAVNSARSAARTAGIRGGQGVYDAANNIANRLSGLGVGQGVTNALTNGGYDLGNIILNGGRAIAGRPGAVGDFGKALGTGALHGGQLAARVSGKAAIPAAAAYGGYSLAKSNEE